LNPAISSSVKQFGLESYLKRLPSELPYADRRLVGIARAVATEPSILLLDEPAAGLDATSTEELIAHIRVLAKARGVGILLIEHDVEMVMKTCDRVLAIDFGKEIASGTPEEVRSNPKVIAAYLGRAANESSKSGESDRAIEEIAPGL
jgi:sulfate-transporting ATPase